MCLAKAYPNTDTSKPILENITYMELGGDCIQLETMFGEEIVVQGRVLEVDFENSKIILDLSDMSSIGDVE